MGRAGMDNLRLQLSQHRKGVVRESLTWKFTGEEKAISFVFSPYTCLVRASDL